MKSIMTCISHFETDKAKKATLCAVETAGDFICGFGMTGAEIFGGQSDYLYSFDMAYEAALHLATHPGEWAGAESLPQAVFDLKVERLSDRVKIIDDPHLVIEVTARNITLEVCPGSNVALGIYRDTQSHPIEKLWTRNIDITVSTDDPPFFYTDMTKEYVTLSRAFDWSKEDFSTLNRTAPNVAFRDKSTKDTLFKRLDTE